jgi:maleylacetate reductase
MKPFMYDALAGRTVFAVGALGQVGDELARLGAQRVFLIVDSQAKQFGDTLTESLGSLVVARWHEVAQHVPFDLAERARAAITEAAADAVVCLGGGSSTGLAKAIALTHDLPIVAIPTTYAGSEQTPIYGLTDARHKQTGRDLKVVPKVVVYDPALTVGLPPQVTGPSAFNALAHCVEALYATGCNPVTSAMALEGVRAIRRSLPRVMEVPDDLDARGDVLYGAYLAGIALGTTSTGLHHKLCHVLGGKFNLVHADTHSIVLPHAVALNAPALPDEMARLEEALGAASGDAAGALHDLALESHVPTRLSELGLSADDLDEAAEAGASEITANPVPVTVEGLARLLRDAYEGTRPPRRQ